ncbi:MULTISPECIES: DUF2017 domain-containing protein [Streptomyces]|uniref:DUF2017 domain-containing protein n=2 Tax=Streptomyces rimosus subsp. rimosus TaxID=132474 RepID=L8EIB1_STRR1|nr:MULTISPECIES: DUF2017 domain-containing protein [Streptomyces]KOG69303.1 hypothetical protein ADK78_34100 [Kitasatospora aureofaciens]MYT43780.1 DUF2017 family protein [Streptomyces sp. SID5471]KEF04009.1 hypothetical protein DF17_26445 [Streptomyces rimosus]KEF17411.1 hypothetical protein DF18_28810 [Streptomyces rimosus]KOT28971.1 hypothetical protein ADK42_33060 [Streptomyces rimosus subsp. rimosus]
MAGHFEPLPGGGAAAPLDEVEISILRSLAVQLMELIGPGEEPAEGADPLAALFTDGPSEPPSDPALARLFPNAYGGPDEVPDDATHAAAAEFRRYTENDLRARKREDALAVVRALDSLGPVGGSEHGAVDGAVLRLKPDESRQWLGALNDLRLAIGTRLEVTDEDESGELLRLPDSDPRKPMVMAYLWLGGLQESLIETLTA